MMPDLGIEPTSHWWELSAQDNTLWLTVYLRTINSMSMLNYSRNRPHYFSSMDFQHNKPIQNVKKKRFFKCSPNIPSGFVMMGNPTGNAVFCFLKQEVAAKSFMRKHGFNAMVKF